MSISRVPPKRIQPKIRSMPLRKTPSAIYIQMHQLANERELLQQELGRLSDRRSQVIQRLQEIEGNLNNLESNASNFAEQSSAELDIKLDARAQAALKKANQAQSSPNDKYTSMSIEY